ncbi:MULTISPECIES: hypothetical protein [unclassified Streptomyces]|uniref:hypothetical protein n=1 Tax=unclassified Streptomyces TaxID=2593676 RepID=UPI002E18907B|nr:MULTISPECIES: hypothetical protein [unclassified Streptomyces]
MPDVGDVVTARLVVEPYDVTTAVTLSVTAPDGTVSAPAVSAADGGKTWSTTLAYTLAGVWLLRWSVSGMGASVENQQVSVAPTPGAGGGGRVYATTTQFAEYLDAAPPVEAARLLREASRLLDADFLLAAFYDTDDDGMPTDPVVAAAFTEAVCAQAEFWGEVGVETDISGPLQGVTLGSLNLQFGAGENRSSPSYYAPRLVRALASVPSDKLRFGVLTGGC